MKFRRDGTIHTFEGPTIFEAYSKLKHELGDNAVILSTKTRKQGGILGLWSQKVVQISATDNDLSVPRRRPAQEGIPLKSAATHAAASAKKPTVEAPPAPVAANSNGESTEMLENFKHELAEIRRMIQDMQDSARFRHWPELPAEFKRAYDKLQSFNIHEDIAKALIHRWRENYPGYEKGTKVDVGLLQRYIEEMLVPAGPVRIVGGRPTVVMLVGPTGVGKTTSLAKLAATHRIKEGREVALITLDTYRIAAVEQLRTYADLIGVPLKVVNKISELEAAIEFYSDKEIIFIDTAGRSPRDVEKMNGLREYVAAAKPDELHLAVSLNVHNDVLKDTLDRFADFPVHKLLLTKLDEAVHFGLILSIISRTEKPIGYITTGQDVPNDIEVATTRRLARLILALEKVRG